jgi:hypothetical protein
MKSIRTTSKAPIMAIDAAAQVNDIVGSHLVSKTPAADAISPYPISRQNYKVVYKRDENGYWNFVQCDACDIN